MDNEEMNYYVYFDTEIMLKSWTISLSLIYLHPINLQQPSECKI